MSRPAAFSIDGEKFELPQGMEGGSFTISSSLHDYSVEWREDEPGKMVESLMAENPRNLLLIDEKVLALHAKGAAMGQDRVLAVPATEEFKSLDGVRAVLDFLMDREFGRDGRLVVVGGGIIQDVGAFSAACYKRGIEWIFVPTTLLAMSDSCIGAKSGVNYRRAKNQVGFFYAPRKIAINPRFLSTLGKRDVLSGMGEILKLHLIGGPEMVKSYLQHEEAAGKLDMAALRSLILASLAVKKAVIERDEFDKSFRKSLNLGHTVGHALEALSGYRIPHGQAVALGIAVANELGNNHHLVETRQADEIRGLALRLVDSGSRSAFKALSLEGLGTAIAKDKKASGGAIQFAMLCSPGETKMWKVGLDSDLVGEISGIVRKLAGKM